MTPFAPYLICEAVSERNNTVSTTSREAHYIHDMTRLDQKTRLAGVPPLGAHSIVPL